MPKARYTIDGEAWVPVSKAAKLLGTNTTGIRKLIEEGKLRSRQSRAGSSILVVDLKQVADLRVERGQACTERQFRPTKTPIPKSSAPLAPRPQRLPGHREQLALPMADSGIARWKRGS